MFGLVFFVQIQPSLLEAPYSSNYSKPMLPFRDAHQHLPPFPRMKEENMSPSFSPK